MTARQAVTCLSNISIRKMSELQFQAKLHGAELKGASVPINEKVVFSKERDEAFTKMVEKANKERFGDN